MTVTGPTPLVCRPFDTGIDGELARAGPATGTRLRTLTGHTDGVSGMAFRPQRLLASGSLDETVQL